jgi:hypothetical protein
MKKLTLKFLPALLLVGLVNLISISAAPTSFNSVDKYNFSVAQDTVTTNKTRAKRGVNEVGSGAKEIGKGTKDLAVSGAKATGKGAKKAGKAVSRTTKKGVKKGGDAFD